MNLFKSIKKDFIHNFGLAVVGFFFYIFTVGSIWGNEKLYSYVFYVVIGIAIVCLYKNQKVLGQYKRYYLWQFAFWILMAISTTYTFNIRKGALYISDLPKIWVKVTSVAIICRDFGGVKKLMSILSISGVAVFFTLLWTGHLYEPWRLGEELMGNANAFGMVITVFLTGTIYYMIFAKSKWIKFLNIIALCLDMYMIFLSGGRKFILYGIVFFYATLVLSNKQKKKSVILVPTIIIALAVGIGYYAIMNVPELYNGVGVRLEGLGSDEGALGSDDQSFLMNIGIEMFNQKPLFGWGIAGFQEYMYKEYGTYFYSHSNYVELLADYGLFGTLLYYSQYLYCLFTMLVNLRRRADEELVLFLPLLLAIMVIEVFSITFNQSAFVPLFVMLISGYCYRLNHKKAFNL